MANDDRIEFVLTESIIRNEYQAKDETIYEDKKVNYK